MPLNKCLNSTYSVFFPFFCLLSVVLLFSLLEWSMVGSTRVQFKPKDWEPMLKNQTKKWKQKLRRHLINRAKKVAKLDKLPPLPEVKIKRMIKKGNSKYHPCSVVKDLCLNGGICQSDGEEWSCQCPLTHYGKSCEFLADQTHCKSNMCENNSTCYSVDTPRTVPNIKLRAKEVEKCSKSGLQNVEKECSFTDTVNYRCWCKPGFEGDFCEFSEGERCCAEDHCNHHGLITNLFNVSKAESCDADQHCNCTCETNYMGENCEQVSPCRDLECLNGGHCEYNSTSDEAQCVCPSPSQFFHDGVRISGHYCEVIVFDESEACYPCNEGKSFNSYLKCLKGKALTTKGVADKFAKQCGQMTCEEKMERAFCMNDGQCQVTVANFSDLSPKYPLFLIPKCQCDPLKAEGDFCEHLPLDECDKKDLALNAKVRENKTEEELVKSVGTEEFLRELKNIVFAIKTMGERDRVVMNQAFERVLRAKGMATFCGPNGLCRPYDEEAGFGCKCDAGYKGSRCEVKDPCWGGQKCPEHSLCVDIPTADEDSSKDDQGILNRTYTCICRTSQDVSAESQCMTQHGALYKKCFDANGQPKCQNDGHCYPCDLDNVVMGKAGVKQSRLPLCDAMEKTRGFRCVCPPGFESSSNCRNESRPCDFHQCQNGAKCIPVPEPDNELNYACKCAPGYIGSLCHRLDTACLTGVLCGNGTCQKDVTFKRGFRCDCFAGYYGFSCQHMRDTGWATFFNDNYRWTYPLLVFSLLTPAVLVAMILQDRRIIAKYGSPENAPSYYQVLSNYVVE